MSRKTKVRLLTAAVESVLTYGSESWTLTKALTNRLNLAFKHRLLRFALDIGWRDHLIIEKLNMLACLNYQIS